MIEKIRTLLVRAGLVLVSAQLISCAEGAAVIQASIDETNAPEGGASRYNTSPAYGFNMDIQELWFDLSNGGSGPPGQLSAARGNGSLYATEDPANNPFDGDVSTGKGSAPAGGHFGVAASGEFVQKGYKAFGAKSRLNYLEGKGDALYSYHLPGGVVFGGLGPYIAYGIGGKSGSGANEVPSFGGDGGLKRLDAGLNLMAGYQFDMGLQLSLGYDLGLTNDSPAPDYTSKNRAFSLSVGYSINKIIGAIKGK